MIYKRQPISVTSMTQLGANLTQADLTQLGATEWYGFNTINFSLPGAGKYVLTVHLGIAISDATTFDNKWVEARLYDATAAAAVPGSEIFVNCVENLGPNGDFFPRSGTICVPYTVTEATTLRIQVRRHSVTNIGLDATKTSYGYLRTY